MSVPVSLPVGPHVTRVFCGYKLPSLSREDFFKHLGATFMPGTPYMQVPLGLNAYTPAVLDVDPNSGLPDEVALIVYAAMEIYQHARQHSLRRRMYTHAHAAVFDMQAAGGGGQFPGPVAEPSQRQDRLSWYLFDRNVDWQDGFTELLFLSADSSREGLREDFIQRTAKAQANLDAAGVNQLIGVATDQYAALWLHSSSPIEVTAEKFDFLPPDTRVNRQLSAEAVPMPNLEEGVEITGASMFCFRFIRENRFHLQLNAWNYRGN